ncbi:hypothetical protein AAFF27_01465 [Xylophilus sp. GW821-FHT01B05]
MTLQYLDFDYSEDDEGTGTFDAMASTAPQQVAAVRAELVRVLAWAHAAFPDARGPVEDGGEWDYDLRGHCESTVPEQFTFDEHAGRLAVQPEPPGTVRHTVNLAISGSAAFCAALREQFALE